MISRNDCAQGAHGYTYAKSVMKRFILSFSLAEGRRGKLAAIVCRKVQVADPSVSGSTLSSELILMMSYILKLYEDLKGLLTLRGLSFVGGVGLNRLGVAYSANIGKARQTSIQM